MLHPQEWDPKMLIGLSQSSNSSKQLDHLKFPNLRLNELCLLILPNRYRQKYINVNLLYLGVHLSLIALKDQEFQFLQEKKQLLNFSH